MERGKRNSNQANRRPSGTARTPRTSSSRNRRDTSDSSDRRSRSRSPSGQQQPSGPSASTPNPTAAAPIVDNDGPSSSRPSDGAQQRPIVDNGPNSRPASEGVQQRPLTVTFSDIMALLARFDEIVNMLNNPEQTFMSDETRDVMTRLFNDLYGLVQRVTGCLHRPPAADRRQAESDGDPSGVQLRSLTATFDDVRLLLAHFGEVVNMMTNQAEAAMGEEILDALTRLFDDLSGPLRWVVEFIDRLTTIPRPTVPDQMYQ